MPIVNPGFEGGNSPWFFQDANTSCTVTNDASIVHSGSGSFKIVNTAAGEDDCGFQDVTGLVSGHIYRVTAWVNCTAFTAAAVANRGLYMYGLTSFLDTVSTVTGTTGGWTQLTADLTLGASDTGVEIRLYAPQGTIYWDDITLTDLSAANDINLPTSARIRFSG